MADPRVISIVGGGVWAAVLCEQLARSLSLERVELRLTARNRERLAIIANDAGHRVARLKPSWRVTAADVPNALEGAGLVVPMLRVGGLCARALDEAFPRRFGLIGDEGLGLGGYANALRTLPVMEGLGRDLARVAADALVLNMVAPLGLTTRALQECGVDAVGVCELPILTERRLCEVGHIPLGALDYIGLNHLGWFWHRSQTFDALQVHRWMEEGVADRDVLSAFAAAPLKYYYRVFSPEAGRRIGVEAPSGRAEELQAIVEDVLHGMAKAPGHDSPALSQRSMPWFSEALAPIAAALLERSTWDGFINCRNGDLVPELPKNGVVEVRCAIEAGLVRPRAPETTTPPRPLAFLQAAAEAERLLWRAHRTGNNEQLLRRAIETMPLPFDRCNLDEMTAAVLACSCRYSD